MSFRKIASVPLVLLGCALLVVLAASCSTTSTQPSPSSSAGVGLPSDQPRPMNSGPLDEAMNGDRGTNILYLASCPTRYNSTALDVRGMYAYVTSDELAPHGALDVINIADRIPHVVGTYDFPGEGGLRIPLDIQVDGTEAYVADMCATPEFGAHLFGLTVADPQHPAINLLTDAPGNPRGIAVANNTVYVACFDGGLATFDTNLWQFGQIDCCRTATDVAIRGTTAYVCCYDPLEPEFGCMSIFDVRDPGNPLRIGGCRLNYGGLGITVTGPSGFPGQRTFVYAAIATGVQIIDVTNPMAPQSVAMLPLAGEVRWVSLVNTKLYVAAGEGGIYVVNVATPSAPMVVGSYNTLGYAMAIKAVGNLLFVADGSGGFSTFRYTGQ